MIRQTQPRGSRILAAVAGGAALLLGACEDAGPLTYQGWIEADFVFVGPDEAGRIEKLAVREGDAVAEGALLFVIDSDLQRADVAAAEATVENARQAFERAEQLLRTKTGTQRAYDEAQAALREAEARLNSARTRLERRRVVSPAAGTVHQVYYRTGEMVPSGRAVVALLPPANVKVRFYVPQAVLPRIALGETIRVACDGCPEDLAARIDFIAQAAEFTPPVIYSLEERAKLVFLVEARPLAPEPLRVGQPVTISLASASVAGREPSR